MRVRTRAVRVLVVVAALALLAGACGDDDGEADGTAEGTTTTASAAEDADRSGELRYGVTFSFNVLDPHRLLAAGDALYMRPVYDRLVTFVPTEEGSGDLGPQLATSWEFAEDGMSIEFELRDDVTFQDGTTFDANLVKANIERALGPGSTVARELASVASVEVVDPTHVVFRLKGPDPSIPWSMAFGSSGMMVSPAAFNTDLNAAPAGSGPFRLVSAAKDGDVVYERWDDHWDPDAALVQRLTISAIVDNNVRYNGAQTGEFEVSYLGTPLDAEARSLTSEGFQWQQALTPVVYGVLLNADMPPFDDVRVRRAVNLAIDRPEISETLLNGINPPTYQPFAEGLLGHDPSLDEDPFDLDEAAALVQEAGAEGATVTVVQQLTAPQDSLAQVVQQALTDIGLTVELVPLSATEARAAWRQGGNHAFVAPIVGRQEPSVTLNLSYLGGDNPGTPPPELVTMAADALVLPVGSDEREEAYQEISAYLVENPINVPIVQFSTVNLCRPEVVGCENLSDIGILDFRGVGVAES